jgi:hypothetical protein
MNGPETGSGGKPPCLSLEWKTEVVTLAEPGSWRHATEAGVMAVHSAAGGAQRTSSS